MVVKDQVCMPNDFIVEGHQILRRSPKENNHGKLRKKTAANSLGTTVEWL